MKVYDDLYVDDYSGMLVYKGHEFVREDIEQMFSVLAQKTSLNVMRLQQSKWDWWYDSERNVITLQEVIDDNEAENAPSPLTCNKLGLDPVAAVTVAVVTQLALLTGSAYNVRAASLMPN